MARVLYLTHPQYLEHDAGRGHPERPSRLGAVRQGLAAVGLLDAVLAVEPGPASLDAVRAVHPGRYVDDLVALVAAGGGRIDADTSASAGSLDAALLAAGAGLDAVARLEAGEAEAAFCAVRPPGHHATPTRAMGFCLVNSVAVVARSLAERGERVLVVDIDAHHGNGTQEVFLADPSVVYASIHQFPMYPGSGWLDEVGEGDGFGATVNVPVPAGATGDVYRDAVDRILAPLAERWRPSWLLVSTGFDAHRADPLTDLGLSAGDYADLTAALVALVPPGRTIVYLEGGYDLDAVALAAAATVGALAGERIPTEAPTSGGPGLEVVDAVVAVQEAVAETGRGPLAT